MKQFSAYKKNNLNGASYNQLVAHILIKATILVEKIIHHTENKEFEARYEGSEELLHLLSGLNTAFETTENKEKIDEIMVRFCQDHIRLMAKSILKNDILLMRSIKRSFQEASEIWDQEKKPVE